MTMKMPLPLPLACVSSLFLFFIFQLKQNGLNRSHRMTTVQHVCVYVHYIAFMLHSRATKLYGKFVENRDGVLLYDIISLSLLKWNLNSEETSFNNKIHTIILLKIP